MPNNIKGNWYRQQFQPYAGATVWGTGINPVHAYYGSDTLRVTGRNQQDPDVTPPAYASEEFLELHAPWGYTPDDRSSSFLFTDDRPNWSVETPEFRGQNVEQPPYNAAGWLKTLFRSRHDGAHRSTQKTANSLPEETVSEGWRNKPRGALADAKPSDPSQYEIQTSMRQRYEVRVNTAAVNRNTDVDRSSIGSRVAGQKLKIYSGEERHYDMFPFQQDEILRPFWYRTAGTGPRHYLEPNAMIVIDPIQRVPPPDPSLGPEETSLDYGYTGEDMFYA